MPEVEQVKEMNLEEVRVMELVKEKLMRMTTREKKRKLLMTTSDIVTGKQIGRAHV